MKSKEKSELNKNFTKLTQKRGISLIVLIVTIIVIIILAAAVILTVGKNNPVESAREAAFKEDLRSFQYDLALSISKDYTANAGQRDSKFSATDFDKIKDYIPSFTKKYEGKFAIVNDELKYVGDEEKEVTWSKELGVKKYFVMPESWKATIAEVTEDGVPIPKGFIYVTGTKETGTVIKDSLDNEFVWIPATEATYVKDLNFPKNCTPTGDDLPSDITDEIADVKKYGGFYIGRYEAGIPIGDTDPSNKIGKPVIKKLATVWTNIDYDNAKASAENMISNDYVQTGLLTGKAWDTTCHWIGDIVDITNSCTYGNYSNSQSPANVTGYGTKQVAGFSDKWSVKNIYDLAGNVWELTAERSSSDCINRGGGFASIAAGSGGPVPYRSNISSSGTDVTLGFRTRIYIK